MHATGHAKPRYVSHVFATHVPLLLSPTAHGVPRLLRSCFRQRRGQWSPAQVKRAVRCSMHERQRTGRNKLSSPFRRPPRMAQVPRGTASTGGSLGRPRSGPRQKKSPSWSFTRNRPARPTPRQVSLPRNARLPGVRGASTPINASRPGTRGHGLDSQLTKAGHDYASAPTGRSLVSGFTKRPVASLG